MSSVLGSCFRGGVGCGGCCGQRRRGNREESAFMRFCVTDQRGDIWGGEEGVGEDLWWGKPVFGGVSFCSSLCSGEGENYGSVEIASDESCICSRCR